MRAGIKEAIEEGVKMSERINNSIFSNLDWSTNQVLQEDVLEDVCCTKVFEVSSQAYSGMQIQEQVIGESRKD